MLKPWESGPLQISKNKRYFTNGKIPFFLLADTAWTMFQKLSMDETYIYLKNRVDKGFTAIACVLINYQSKAVNSKFEDVGDDDVLEFLKPKYDEFWQHVKQVLKMAEKLGLYIMLLPVWGKVVKHEKLNMSNVLTYTNFLIEEFKKFPNIIWVLGGDVRGDIHFDVWDTMGKLFKQKDPNRLIGFHPFGRTSSSYWFQDCAWLDFHMFQSGHRRSDQKRLMAWDEAASNEPWFGEESFLYVRQDYNKLPTRPIIDGEPSYEQILQGLHNPNEPYWQAHHVRRYAYWSVLSGSAGHIYGHNAIIQFYGAGSNPEYGAIEKWPKAIHDIGSDCMKIMKDLLIEVDFSSMHPMLDIFDQTDWLDQNDTNIAQGNDKHILVYSYSGKPFKIKGLSAKYDAYWVDPISGVKGYFGKIDPNNDDQFLPPDKKTAFNDWLLLLTK